MFPEFTFSIFFLDKKRIHGTCRVTALNSNWMSFASLEAPSVLYNVKKFHPDDKFGEKAIVVEVSQKEVGKDRVVICRKAHIRLLDRVIDIVNF